jgi:hypothetical protein
MNTGRERSVGARLFLCFLLSLGVLLSIAHTAQARERLGTLAGTLTDPSVGILQGVAITITNNQTVTGLSAATSLSGTTTSTHELDSLQFVGSTIGYVAFFLRTSDRLSPFSVF